MTNIRNYPTIKQSCVTWNDAQFNSILSKIEVNDFSNEQKDEDPEHLFNEIKVSLSSNTFDTLFGKEISSVTKKGRRLVQRYVEVEIVKILQKCSRLANLKNLKCVQYKGKLLLIEFKKIKKKLINNIFFCIYYLFQ